MALGDFLMKFCKYGILTVCMLIGANGLCATVNDESNYLGDKISFPVNIDAKVDGNKYCIPAGTSLRSLNKNGEIFKLANVVGSISSCDNSGKTVPQNETITIDKTVLDTYAPSRHGLTYGGLIVPFKYHMTGEKNLDLVAQWRRIWDIGLTGIILELELRWLASWVEQVSL
jgi:hypothetical protein